MGTYEYRVMMDGRLPDDWHLAWDDDLSLVEEEAEAFRGLGRKNVRIERRRKLRGDADAGEFMAWAANQNDAGR